MQRFGVAADLAEDLLHEVFLVVRRRLDDFDRTRSLRAWLYGIARRVVANHRRGALRAQARLGHLRALPSPSPVTPEEAVAHREAVALVGSFLATLEGPRREVFELIEIEGMGGPEVAEALGLSQRKVHTSLRSARNSLRAFLRGRLGEPADARAPRQASENPAKNRSKNQEGPEHG